MSLRQRHQRDPDDVDGISLLNTNIQMPRAWRRGMGCIAQDVGAISTADFHAELTDFRTFMENEEIADIDIAWRSMCFQYESLAEDPMHNGTHARFSAMAAEWSMRRRMYATDGNEMMAKAIVQNFLSLMR